MASGDGGVLADNPEIIVNGFVRAALDGHADMQDEQNAEENTDSDDYE